MAFSNAKQAILKSKIEGVIYELLVKTSAAMVYLDDTTTLETKLTELVTAINGKATPQDISDAITALNMSQYAKSADLTALAELVGELPADVTATTVVDYISEAIQAALASADMSQYAKTADLTALAGKVTTLIGDDTGKSARAIAAEELAKQLIPENAKESLDSLAEVAAWIQTHPDDAAAMNAAIAALQSKVTLGTYDDEGTQKEYDTVKAYVEAAIAALKIGDYAKAADLTALAGRVTTLEGKAHTHANGTVLDGITAEDVAGWNGKSDSKVYYSATEPAELKAGDLWVQLV